MNTNTFTSADHAIHAAEYLTRRDGRAHALVASENMIEVITHQEAVTGQRYILEIVHPATTSESEEIVHVEGVH
jgi:hypothetical protein